jgi:hypothetical protein
LRPVHKAPLLDCPPDVVFVVENGRGEDVVLNQTPVERCGRRTKPDG